MAKDICCVGHITRDHIITPDNDFFLSGGTSFYFSYALRALGCENFSLVTSLASSDMEVVHTMRRAGIEVEVIPSRETVFFENRYGENMNNRTQRVLAKADPFSPQALTPVDARFVHLGSLLADDFSPEVIKSLSQRCTLSVDAQGFLRYVSGDKVLPCDWDNKREVFPYIHILKVNECEIKALTGTDDAVKAGEILTGWGIKEALITLGSYGSVIYSEGKHYNIPAYRPTAIIDATGCGDTYAAGYLYKRALGAGIEESGNFAAALSSLKLAKIGPFNGSLADVEEVLASKQTL